MSFTTAFFEEIEKIAKKKGSSLLGTVMRGAAYGAVGSSVLSVPAAVRMAMKAGPRAGAATTLLTALLPTMAGAAGGALAYPFVKRKRGPARWKKPSRWDL